MRWTPLELLAFLRDQREAISMPGEKYNDSDTGFIILGLLVETMYSQAFHEALAIEILNPLDMQDTFMPFLSKPANGKGDAIRMARLDKAEISTNTGITADWSGDGVASITTPG